MAKTRARLIASASSVDLAKRAGASSGDAVKPGDVRRIGPWKIRVLSATHDRLFGKVPFDRPPSQAGLSAEAAYSAEAAAKAGSAKAKPPQRAADWICGEPLAFLIEVNGQRIYIDSGGTPTQLPPNEARGPGDSRHGVAGFACATGRSARAPAAAIHFAESPGRFLPAVERRISIWAAHRFSSCATRVCAAESQSLNSPGLFSAMDTAEGSRLQIPKAD